MIIPCGIQGAKITSMKIILGDENINLIKVESSIINAFSKVFNRVLLTEIASDDLSLYTYQTFYPTYTFNPLFKTP